MKNTIFFIFTLLLPFVGCHAKDDFKYELCACAMFQDEAPYLKEWIEYYSMLGVEHFYLYNNSSSDDYYEVLEPYLDSRKVELFDWPSPRDKVWDGVQQAAYNDCLKRCKKKTNWLAIVDIDEYIVPHKTNSLVEFLRPYDKAKGIGGVLIHWQMFGTSDVWEIPHNMSMIECLTRKAIRTCGHNQNVKSIVKPRYCAQYFLHEAVYQPGYSSTLPYNSGSWPHIDTIQINHYWLRNEKFLREVKAPRRARFEGATWSEEIIQSYIHEMNADVDTSILRFVPQLRKRMGLDR